MNVEASKPLHDQMCTVLHLERVSERPPPNSSEVIIMCVCVELFLHTDTFEDVSLLTRKCYSVRLKC